MAQLAHLPPFGRSVQLNPFGNGTASDDLPISAAEFARFRIHEEDDLIPEFQVSDLDKNAGRLLFASTSISPLHKLRLEGREIIVTEDPRLHLLTSYSKVFLKPLPPYLTLYDFWDLFGSSSVRPAMLGHLRTWCYLIRHESDFHIAMRGDSARVPLLPHHFTWEHFRDFSAEVILHIGDEDVSPRYKLGELRLSRLNLVARPLFKRSTYYDLPQPRQPINWPHLFLGLFALFSVILSAMQVVLAVEGLTPKFSQVMSVFRWSSIIFLLFFCIGFAAILAFGVHAVFQEWTTVRKLNRRMRESIGLV